MKNEKNEKNELEKKKKMWDIQAKASHLNHLEIGMENKDLQREIVQYFNDKRNSEAYISELFQNFEDYSDQVVEDSIKDLLLGGNLIPIRYEGDMFEDLKDGNDFLVRRISRIITTYEDVKVHS